MRVTRLSDGRLQVPFRIEVPGVMIGDAVKTIDATDPEYDRWLKYLEEQEEDAARQRRGLRLVPPPSRKSDT